jgi:hypothetical protein
MRYNLQSIDFICFCPRKASLESPPESLSTTFLFAPGYAEFKERRPAHASSLADQGDFNAGGFRNGDRGLCKIHCRKGLGLEGPGI